MTNEEVIERLKYECDFNCWGYGKNCNKECFMYIAIESVEKQIPKKPVIQDDKAGHKIYSCECGYLMRCEHKSGGTFHGLKRKYCPDCGQAIDWSE